MITNVIFIFMSIVFFKNLYDIKKRISMYIDLLYVKCISHCFLIESLNYMKPGWWIRPDEKHSDPHMKWPGGLYLQIPWPQCELLKHLLHFLGQASKLVLKNLPSGVNPDLKTVALHGPVAVVAFIGTHDDGTMYSYRSLLM